MRFLPTSLEGVSSFAIGSSSLSSTVICLVVRLPRLRTPMSSSSSLSCDFISTSLTGLAGFTVLAGYVGFLGDWAGFLVSSFLV